MRYAVNPTWVPPGFSGWEQPTPTKFGHDRCVWVDMKRSANWVAMHHRATGRWDVGPNSNYISEWTTREDVVSYPTMEAALTALRIIEAAEGT